MCGDGTRPAGRSAARADPAECTRLSLVEPVASDGYQALVLEPVEL